MAGKAGEAIYPVEKLCEKCRVGEAVHNGACLGMGWHPNKEVTEKEYAAAIKSFREAVAGRRVNA